MNESDLFAAAIEFTDLDARARYLDEACRDDPELRRRVERLLKQAAKNDTFMEPKTNLDDTASMLSTKEGSLLGPYKLKQKIGEGGMGIVFVAEQLRPVQRRVALKIIKPGMDSHQVLARFEAERQTLAMMEHPNIAKMLDAGATEQGLPYFVMELVDGAPINRYCDENQLTIRERLALFRGVCEGVQHAHQKGVIHRDLKPTNILVAQYDGRPVPKVIDFGVAKAIGQQLSEHSVYTQLGQVLGTLEYMSPEQASRNQMDVDTRSDIYSLGVVLYELLTGELPFDKNRLRKAPLDELFRIIREEEPLPPSTRVSGRPSTFAEAKNRKTDPARLEKLFRGELDWIAMKALEKELNRRYKTASELAADINRYLDDEPVLACPPTARYRLVKFCHRNWAALSVAGIIGFMLITGTVISLRQAIRANRAEARAVSREREAKSANQALTDKVVELKSARQKISEAFEQLERTQQQSDRNFDFALNGLQEFFGDFANSMLSQIPGKETEKQRLLSTAVTRFRELTQANPHRPDIANAYANVLFEIGEFAVRARDWELARTYFRECIAVRSQLNPGTDQTELFVVHQHQLVDAHEGLAAAWIEQDALQAEAFFQKAVQIAATTADSARSQESIKKLARAHNHLGIFRFKTGQADEAMQEYRKALEAADGSLRGAILHNMALCETSRGRIERALELIDEAVKVAGQGDRNVEKSWLVKAKLHFARGEFEIAKRPSEKATGIAYSLDSIQRQLQSGIRGSIISDFANADRTYLEISADILKLQASIYSELGETEAAVKVLEHAVWLCRFSLPAKPIDENQIKLVSDLEERLGNAYLAIDLDEMANRHLKRAAELKSGVKLIPEKAIGQSFRVSGIEPNFLEAIAIDESGAIFVGGAIGRHADFDVGIKYRGLPEFRGAMVCHYTRDCEILWIRPLGASPSGIVEDMTLDSDNNILVVGHMNVLQKHKTIQFGNVELASPKDYEGPIAFVAKLTPEGNVLWARWAGRGKSPHVIEDATVSAAPDNRVWVGGTFLFSSQIGDNQQGLLLRHPEPGERRGYFACFDADGTARFVQSIDADTSGIRDISCGADGSVNMCGAARPIQSTTFGRDIAGNAVQLSELGDPDGSAGFLLSVDASGTVKWVRPQVCRGGNLSHGVATGEDGRIYLTTLVYGKIKLDALNNHPDGKDVVDDHWHNYNGTNLSCWDSDGNFLWHRQLGKQGRRVHTRGLTPRSGGGVFLTGFISGRLLFFNNQPLPRYCSSGLDGFVMEIGKGGELINHWFYLTERGATRIRGLDANSRNQVVVVGHGGRARMPTGEILGAGGLISLIEPHSPGSSPPSENR